MLKVEDRGRALYSISAVGNMVGLPVASTTSLSFGGPNLDIAFVTSMARPIKGVLPPERDGPGPERS